MVQISKNIKFLFFVNLYYNIRDSHGTYGRLLRNEKGCWQWGFAGSITAEGPLHAEIIVLQVGMQMLSERGLSRVMIETDLSQLLHLFHGHVNDDHPYYPDLLTCKNLHTKLWSSPVIYTSRVCNIPADHMARLGDLHTQPWFCWFDVAPNMVRQVVENDVQF